MLKLSKKRKECCVTIKTILVTGGAGFIGSHICEAYVKRGYEVVIVDNLSSGKIENLDAVINLDMVQFYQADIRDIDALRVIFEKHQPAIINHHAAQKSVAYSVLNPRYDLELNLCGLLNLIELTKEYPVENFIYVSSGGALSKEIVRDEKSSETDFPQLQSPYAITKFAGENYIKVYSKLYGFGFSILRYANIYGPRQIADGECGVVPIFVNNILAGKPSVLMTYDDMPGGCTRDYVFVKDVVDINLSVTETITNEVLNIGSGKEIGMLELYEKIAQAFQSNLEITRTGPRLGDIKRSVLDNSKTKGLLGWEPSVSFEEGLKILKQAYFDL